MEHSVLLVDDKADNLSMMVGLLREMGLSKRVYSAPNGEVAYTLALKYTPDLILTDWAMPVMDGLELVKQLKNNLSTKDIPVIMITAIMTDSLQLKEAFDIGAHDFLKKPFSNLEFFARIGNAIKLDKAYKDMAETKEKLQELNVLKDKIFSIISHDMAAPISSLSSLLAITIDQMTGFSPGEARKYFIQINQQVVNIRSLLKNLLEWSQAQLLEVPLNKTVKVQPLVDEIFLLQKQKAMEKNIDLISYIPDNLELFSDPDMLSFVLRNIIVNAIKYTQDGKVVISASTHEGHATFEIEDTGIGMDKTTLKSIFQDAKVFSAKGTNNEPGTGIGLTLCQEYIQKYGGEIKVFSTLGEGSKFSITIPISS